MPTEIEQMRDEISELRKLVIALTSTISTLNVTVLQLQQQLLRPSQPTIQPYGFYSLPDRDTSTLRPSAVTTTAKLQPVPLPFHLHQQRIETLIEAQRHPDFVEKKKHVVIERLPEKDDDEDDQSLMKEIVDSVLDADEKNEIRKDFQKVERHGNTKGKRVTKVYFATEKSAKTFMRLFGRSTAAKTAAYNEKPFVRRDMTPIELDLQRTMRKFVNEANQVKKQFFYRDLNIFYLTKSG